MLGSALSASALATIWTYRHGDVLGELFAMQPVGLLFLAPWGCAVLSMVVRRLIVGRRTRGSIGSWLTLLYVDVSLPLMLATLLAGVACLVALPFDRVLSIALFRAALLLMVCYATVQMALGTVVNTVLVVTRPRRRADPSPFDSA